MQWINRLEFKLGRFAIPNLIQYIAGLNVLAFVLSKINPHFFQLLTLDPELIKQGQIWRLVTYIFIPSIGSPMTEYLNVFMYVFFLLFLGRGLEQAWGAFKLNLFYLIGMIGTTVAAFFVGTEFSGFLLNTSLFFAFAWFYPDVEIYLFFFFLPIKIKWLAGISAVFLGLQFLASGNSFRAAVIAALANFILFFGKEIYNQARMRKNVTERRARFKQEAMPESDAMHSCAVCGKTNITHSELEFRVGKDGKDYCIEHLPKKV